MAKGDYNEETIETICTAIALTGSDKAAYESAGISKNTFYRWQNESDKSDFCDRLARARTEYRRNLSDEKIRQANKAFNEYLYDGVTEEWRKEFSEVYVNGDTRNQKIHRLTQTVKRGVPQWAIERVLGKPLDVLECVKGLVEANILPRWIVAKVADEITATRSNIAATLNGVLPPEQFDGSKPGISDETAIAIRSLILEGIAPSIASLPEQVDQ